MSRFDYKKSSKFNKFNPKKFVSPDESAGSSVVGQDKPTGTVAKSEERSVAKPEDSKPRKYNKHAKLKCFMCKKVGHISTNCWYRDGGKGKKGSNIKQTDIQEDDEEVCSYEFHSINIQVDKPRKEITLAKAGLGTNKQLMASVELQHECKKVPMPF